METKYPHLQEVLDRVKQANKEIRDNKEYKEKVIDGLGIPVFFSDQLNNAGNRKIPAGETNGETN